MKRRIEIVKSELNIVTITDVLNQLQHQNLRKGDTVIVHSSLSSLGYVIDGSVAIIESLMKAVGENGTLIMPTHSMDKTNPINWNNPPIPKAKQEYAKMQIMPYNKQNTPTLGMGIIPEVFRKYNNVIRNNHPTLSIAAWGKEKYFYAEDVSFDLPYGNQSPYMKLYENNAYVLLLGVGYSSNTSFHVAEMLCKEKTTVNEETIIIDSGKPKWIQYQNILTREEIFDELGKEFERSGSVSLFKIGNANCKLFRVKDCVQFAINYLNENS